MIINYNYYIVTFIKILVLLYLADRLIELKSQGPAPTPFGRVDSLPLEIIGPVYITS